MLIVHSLRRNHQPFLTPDVVFQRMVFCPLHCVFCLHLGQIVESVNEEANSILGQFVDALTISHVLAQHVPILLRQDNSVWVLYSLPNKG